MKISRQVLKTFLIIGFIIMNLSCFSQGDKYFKEKQFSLAVDAYLKEVDANPQKYADLAKSYFGIKDFEAAITAMENYKSKYSKADATYADWFIDILKRDDTQIPMQQVKGNINTALSESVPRISSTGDRLYFKSQDRPGGKGGEDIWYSDKQPDGTWGTPVVFSELSTPSHETLYSISADGRVAVLFGNYPGSFGGGDLFYSVKTDDAWSFPCNLGGAINTNKWEAQATLSPDGKTLIFVSNNKQLGAIGISDLYFSKLTDTGWSKPENLGDVINTAGSEIRPSFGADGKTLYFSSDSHKGFGGTDIFMTKRLDDTYKNWSSPINLGRYINTLQDDEDISVTSSGTTGYTVKYNEVGAPGDYDIFEFIMPKIARPEQTIKVTGFVKNEKDSAAAVNIRITNFRTGALQTIVPSMSNDGFYIVNLPFNPYLFEIDMKGFLYYSEEIDLSDSSKFLPKINFRERIGTEYQNKLNEFTSRLHANNLELQDLNNSESYDLEASFRRYEEILREQKILLVKIEEIIADRKYEWLAEETKYIDIHKDFKVQRSTTGATFKLENIFFDLGKANLKPESIESLDNLYDILVRNDISIELGGHTDSIGSNESNILLSQERVNSVKTYLVAKGIADYRIVAVGYGWEKPVASNDTEEGRALNRRVEVKIIEKIKPREGVDQDLVEKQEEEKESLFFEPEPEQEFDLLMRLETAANAGGLPPDSPCDKNEKSSGLYTKGKVKYSSHEEFDREDYIYQGFNAGIENFGFTDMSAFWGVNIRLVNLKTLGYNKLVKEHNFSFFPKTSPFEFGTGYQYTQFISTKTWSNLPIGFIWGLEGKFFKIDNPEKNDDFQWYAGIPLGLRGLIPVKDFVFAPDLQYHFSPVGTEYESTKNKNSSYFEIGVNVRWKFLYGGVSLNRGKKIQYTGLKAGVTF